MIKKVLKEKKLVSCSLMCLFCAVRKCRRRKKYLRKKSLIYCRPFKSTDDNVVFFDDVSEKDSILSKIGEMAHKGNNETTPGRT